RHCSSARCVSSLVRRRSRTSTLFPYTTLFRSFTTIDQVRWSRLPRCDGSIGSLGSAQVEPRSRCNCKSRINDSSHVAGPALMKRSEEHTSELQSRENLVCRLLLEKKKAMHARD